jgi:hypothetical protein
MKPDRLYQIERNKLIPFAEKYADSAAGPRPKKVGDRWGYKEQAKLEAWNVKWKWRSWLTKTN